MRFDRLAEDYLERANSRLVASEEAIKRRAYPDVIRYCQECVEMSLKAVLRLIGIEYPRQHDVSDVLIDAMKDFPDWFQKQIQQFADISKKLDMERGPSVYGEEERGIPPSDLFTKKDADEALAEARHVYRECRKLAKRSIKETDQRKDNEK